jgi:hypothetical protein
MFRVQKKKTEIEIITSRLQIIEDFKKNIFIFLEFKLVYTVIELFH